MVRKDQVAPGAQGAPTGRGRLSPHRGTACQHTVQFYDRTAALFATLTPFLAGGLDAGEACVVIATPAHHASLYQQLVDRGYDLTAAIAQNRYIPLDASVTLAQFMRGDRPDEGLFRRTLEPVLTRAAAGGRPVRAFGEMVALLWAQGQGDATFELERLWHPVCAEHRLPLHCAYPRAGFTGERVDAVRDICALHSGTVDSPPWGGDYSIG